MIGDARVRRDRRRGFTALAGVAAAAAIVAGGLTFPGDPSPSGGPSSPAGSALRASPPEAATPEAGPGSLGRVTSLVFEQNVGQFDPAVLFVGRAGGYSVRLTRGGVSVTGPGGESYSLALERADEGALVEGGPRAASVSSLLGSDPDQWHVGVPTHSSVAYRGVRPGVDLVLYGNGSRLEYDLVVAPGTDPSGLAMRVGGDADVALRVGDGGELVLGVAGGGHRFLEPRLYQDRGGVIEAVQGAYEVRGRDRFGFAVGPYDQSLPLVIDPVLVNSSYLGGSSTDTAYDVAVDPAGNAFVTGYTESIDFPSVGAAQPELAQHPEGTRTDAFITKVGVDGTVLWSSYLGGRGKDAGFAVAAGPDGSAFVLGYTESTDFPVKGADGGRPLRANFSGGGSDVTLTKFTPDGAIDYSTYLGGSGSDIGNGVAIGADGSAYVVGSTGSIDFPVANAARPSLGGVEDIDGFVTKVSPDGSSLIYSTFLGGSRDDHTVAIAVGADGSAYVTGDTRSSDFPTVVPVQVTSGGAGTGLGASFADAFVTKLDPSGASLVYSTYLGGTENDKGTAIAVDAAGNAYVAGNTGSSNFPLASAFQDRKDGDFDAFVAMLDPTGSALGFSTYLGGSQSDGAEGIVVDNRGNVWATGSTASPNFPSLSPVQGAKGGGILDAFVVQFDPRGGSLLTASYLGGRDEDQGAAVGIGPDGRVIVAGYTNSPDFPLAAAFQGVRGGGVGDAFIVRIEPDPGVGGFVDPTAVSARHDQVRLWVTVAGGLLALALVQTLWLRRRREPDDQPVATVPQAEGARLPRDLSSVPRRNPLESKSVDGRAFGGSTRAPTPVAGGDPAPNDDWGAGTTSETGSVWVEEPPSEKPEEPPPSDPARPAAQPPHVVEVADDDTWSLPGGSLPGARLAGRSAVGAFTDARSPELAPTDQWSPTAAVPPAVPPPGPTVTPASAPAPATLDPPAGRPVAPVAPEPPAPTVAAPAGAPGADSGRWTTAGAAPGGTSRTTDDPADPADPARPADRFGGGRPADPVDLGAGPPPAAPIPAATAPAENARPLEAQGQRGGESTSWPAPTIAAPTAGSAPSVATPPSAGVAHLAATAAADLAAAASRGFDRVPGGSDRPPGRGGSEWAPGRDTPPAPLPAAELAELSLSELLSEDLPIPATAPPEVDSFSLADLLDEDLPVPDSVVVAPEGGPFDGMRTRLRGPGEGSRDEDPRSDRSDTGARTPAPAPAPVPASQAPPVRPAEAAPAVAADQAPRPAPSPPPPAPAAPAPTPPAAAAPVAPSPVPAAAPPPAARPTAPVIRRPPPGPSPYGDLFAPDPDDPLVQATRSYAEAAGDDADVVGDDGAADGHDDPDGDDHGSERRGRRGRRRK